MAIFTLMEDIDSLKSRENCIQMTGTLVQSSKLFPMARGIVRMIEPTAHELGVELPEEMTSMIAEFGQAEWRSGDEALFNSALPNYALRRKFGPGDQYMSELLNKWKGLSFD